jgi:hypothetical protein
MNKFKLNSKVRLIQSQEVRIPDYVDWRWHTIPIGTEATVIDLKNEDYLKNSLHLNDREVKVLIWIKGGISLNNPHNSGGFINIDAEKLELIN